MFTSQDLALGMHFLEVMAKEFDPMPFEALVILLTQCCYFNAFFDGHDRRILKAVLESCINESAVSTNRYRFSSASDFFVPNKTLYKDYIEFIKGLPTNSDHEVHDLVASSQINKDFNRGLTFLHKLQLATGIRQVDSKTSVLELTKHLLENVSRVFAASHKIAIKDNSGLRWLWEQELEVHCCLLNTATRDLEKLLKCALGQKVLDEESNVLAKKLKDGVVPKKWCSNNANFNDGHTEAFLKTIERRLDFYKNMDTTQGKIVPLSVLFDPLRILMAIKLQYASTNGKSVEDVDYKVTFHESQPSADNGYVFTDLVLTGAKWDYERQRLLEKNEMHVHDTDILFAHVEPTEKQTVDDDRSVYACPLYSTKNRRITCELSSILVYFNLESDMPSNILLKRGVMLAITG